MPTNDPNPLRTDSDDLDLHTAATNAYSATCQRLGLSHYQRARHLHAAMIDLVMTHARGARPEELLAPGLALLELARTLTSTHHDGKEIARIALHNDLADDHFRGIAEIEGRTPVVKREWIAALRKTNTSNEALIRELERELRQDNLNRAIAQQRLGITGGAA